MLKQSFILKKIFNDWFTCQHFYVVSNYCYASLRVSLIHIVSILESLFHSYSHIFLFSVFCFFVRREGVQMTSHITRSIRMGAGCQNSRRKQTKTNRGKEGDENWYFYHTYFLNIPSVDLTFVMVKKMLTKMVTVMDLSKMYTLWMVGHILTYYPSLSFWNL